MSILYWMLMALAPWVPGGQSADAGRLTVHKPELCRTLAGRGQPTPQATPSPSATPAPRCKSGRLMVPKPKVKAN
ncbi:hypothetical protein [Sphingomonas sp.]|uniref:hypothetical protein n=1 Tax=Sphingomonas sp. TaxID=28214 RepID=UPI001B11608E|nr:hypothetical protein [Sphingomonas sp.]MBO9713688.1 hypothetical protein [Sphingomonas sp.]